jgi:hypothetical protein
VGEGAKRVTTGRVIQKSCTQIVWRNKLLLGVRFATARVL